MSVLECTLWNAGRPGWAHSRHSAQLRSSSGEPRWGSQAKSTKSAVVTSPVTTADPVREWFGIVKRRCGQRDCQHHSNPPAPNRPGPAERRECPIVTCVEAKWSIKPASADPQYTVGSTAGPSLPPSTLAATVFAGASRTWWNGSIRIPEPFQHQLMINRESDAPPPDRQKKGKHSAASFK